MAAGPGGAYGERVFEDLFLPWRRSSTWWALTHLALDVFVGSITFSVTVTLLVTTVALLITFPLAIPFAWLLFVTSRGMARAERTRIAALLGVEIDDPVPPLQSPSWWGRLVERARSGARWREIAYQVLALPLGILTTTVAILAWSGAAALALMPFYVGALPDDTAHFWLFDVTQGPGAIAVAVVGVGLLAVVAPWVTVLFARLDVVAARWLLAPPRRDVLDEQVSRLETSRAAAVDSAETERRRIERDLHDGAQQRLVALAIDLGAARERLDDDPEAGRQLVAEAHEEAKAALREIRDLVRGIHPAILSDRGLDAALSAVVARSPVPVTLQVTVAERPPPAVESAAYFVVAEALTNVARHSRATTAAVTIERAGDRLVVEVRDDGVGGAAVDGGSGLRGLQDRITALGGTFHILSPDGGPTSLIVELPCGS
jgi:signal transduction histidine kinase